MDDDVLEAVVAHTGQLVAQEVEELLAMIRLDPPLRRLEMVPVLVRGTTTAVLDALSAGTPEQAIGPLARLAGGAWLALILLSLDPELMATGTLMKGGD